jgi:8-oxo-dGTP pyrophosphatase MutT (NUDIX family)
MKELFKGAVHMIIKKDNKILVQKRIGTKLWPNYYALPAGHIDKGENQYDALVREAKEELGIDIILDKTIKEYLVLRRNHFEIDGKQLEPYIDIYFEINNYIGEVKIMEKDKCEELIWVDEDKLPYPFINYQEAFLKNNTIKFYDCVEHGAYNI